MKENTISRNTHLTINDQCNDAFNESDDESDD